MADSSDPPGGDASLAGVRLSHPDKLLYSEPPLTKRELAEYYLAVAEQMLPHVAGRPLAIVRCPAGQGRSCFFQKHLGEGPPEQLGKVDVSTSGKPEYHLTIDDAAGLVALVQLGALEIHVWGARVDQLEKPDRLVFDLDPDPAVEWAEVVAAAKEIRTLLADFDLKSFVKTTGGKGLHLVVPIQPRADWDLAKAFCKAVADAAVRAAPERYVATMSKAARKGKIFIDYLRNARGATSVAPYSTRNRPARAGQHADSLGGADGPAAFGSLHGCQHSRSAGPAETRSLARARGHAASDHRGHAQPPEPSLKLSAGSLTEVADKVLPRGIDSVATGAGINPSPVRFLPGGA